MLLSDFDAFYFSFCLSFSMFVLLRETRETKLIPVGTATPGLGHDLYHPPRHPSSSSSRMCFHNSLSSGVHFFHNPYVGVHASPRYLLIYPALYNGTSNCAGALVIRTLPAQ
jgi:hypothetical protein